MESTLAILGIFFAPVVMIVLIVWFVNDAKKKRYQLQAELYAKALEKGQAVPVDFFAGSKKDSNFQLDFQLRSKPLNTGIICIAVGIGVALFIWLSQGAIPGGHHIGRAASLGIIPFMIGVAYVVIHFIEKKQTANENAE